MAFSFSDMDLTNVNVSSGQSLLKPGDYVAKIIDAKMGKTKDKTGDRLEVKFQDTKGSGVITNWFNMYLPGSTKATSIGREQLKTTLYYGGHPNHNKPSDVNSMIGLVVGIHVKSGEPFQKGGETITNPEFDYAFDPFKLDPTNFTQKPEPVRAEQPVLSAVNSGIPF